MIERYEALTARCDFNRAIDDHSSFKSQPELLYLHIAEQIKKQCAEKLRVLELKFCDRCELKMGWSIECAEIVLDTTIAMLRDDDYLVTKRSSGNAIYDWLVEIYW